MSVRRRAKLVFNWFRGLYSESSLTLGYHRVAAADNDLYNLCVSPQNFRDHMEILANYAHPVSTESIIYFVKKKTIKPKSVAVTIDDAYTDVLNHALPALQTYKIPATIFVTTGFLGKEFWWDKLYRIFMEPEKLPPTLTLSVRNHKLKGPIDSAEDSTAYRTRLIKRLYNILRLLPSREIEWILDSLASQTGISGPPATLAISKSELVQLSNSNLIDIGSHAVTHPFMAFMTEAEQREEIHSSREDLQKLLGKQVRCFSYPNGSFNNVTRHILRNEGYNLAFSSRQGRTVISEDPYDMPRFWIPNWPADKFYSWLKLWLL